MNCLICDVKFSTKGNLERHLKRIHASSLTLSSKCPYNEMVFNSFTEFISWKEDIEQKTLSSYVKQRGEIKKSNGDVHIYYNCCRSGTYIPKGKGLRKIKSQKSAKIGYCPSKIHVKLKNGEIFVQHFHHHGKHEDDLHHVRIGKSDRVAIAKKLVEGFTAEEIVTDIHKLAVISKCKRKMLITKKDIYNIKRDFKIGDNVEEQENSEDNNSHLLMEMDQNETENCTKENSEEVVEETSFCIRSKIDTFVELYEKCKFTEADQENLDVMVNNLIHFCTDHLSNNVEEVTEEQELLNLKGTTTNLSVIEKQYILNESDIMIINSFDHPYL